VTVGLPLPAGRVRDVGTLTVLSADLEHALPLQCEPLEHWPDGSVRWVLLDWLLPAGATEAVLAVRERGEGVPPSCPAGILSARGGEDGLTSSVDQPHGAHNAGETPASRGEGVPPSCPAGILPARGGEGDLTSSVDQPHGAHNAGETPATRGEGVPPSCVAGILPARSGEDGLTSSVDQANGTHNAGETPASQEAPATQEPPSAVEAATPAATTEPPATTTEPSADANSPAHANPPADTKPFVDPKPFANATPFIDTETSRRFAGSVSAAVMRLMAQMQANTASEPEDDSDVPAAEDVETLDAVAVTDEPATAHNVATTRNFTTLYAAAMAQAASPPHPAAVAIAQANRKPPVHAIFLPASGKPWSAVRLADGRGLIVEAEDQAGETFWAKWHDVREETDGPVRRSIHAIGRLTGPSGELAEVELRLHTFAGTPAARAELTVRNPRASSHPGGCWDLGNDGSIYFRRLTAALGGPWRQTAVSAQPDLPAGTVAGNWTLWQASSGKPNWKSSNHVNRRHEIPLPFRGYRLATARSTREGLHATPLVIARGSGASVGLAVENFWQNFPQSVESRDGNLLYHLFPPQMPDVQELSGGEQKTWTFHWAAGGESMSAESLAWCREQAVVTAEPEYYASTGALPNFVTTSDGDPAYGALVDAALDGDDTFEHKRDVLDEYGWRHFGDIYGDHEAVFAKGDSPMVSHYNNQYDAVLGMALQGLRSGDGRWMTASGELARHVIDIDVYHTAADKSAYNGGMFWHTVHYIDADTTGHRTYPAASRRGGGPSPGHLYTSGLMYTYWLTGDRWARGAAIGLGQFVIDCDDGSKTVFRHLSRRHTGLATESAPDYHGPGRASGNALNALLDAHRLSGEPRFLDKAQQIIRRCIHPADDFTQLNLLDTERRWFYTMFLQSLGKFLDYKADLGQLDAMYAYARASLLHYAQWMAANEYPYLDKPENLEFPTETWAAQDMRKSEVFAYAVRHAEAEDREWFRERCEFFFRDAVGRLTTMPTRTLARPVVLLLTNGLMCQYLRLHPDAATPAPAKPHSPASFGAPMDFRPQKRVAIQRAKMIAAVGAVVFVAVVAAVVWWWVR